MMPPDAQRKATSDSADNRVPWITPRSIRGVPAGYRAFVVVASLIGIFALPYGTWSYLLGIAGLAAMAHQAVLDKATVPRRTEGRTRCPDAD